MTSSARQTASTLVAKVAEKYAAQGFEVNISPRKEELPFDLGTYRPDLIAVKQPDKHYIIEVKSSASRTPVERYSEVAKLVGQHPGWSFLLVTGDEKRSYDEDLLTWEQMTARQAQVEALLELRASEGAFLILWGILEAALRRRAGEVSIPIEHFPTSSLLNHLYSQGELSIEQFDEIKALRTFRNRFVHGYQTPEVHEPTERLEALVKQLLADWTNTNSD